MGSGVSALDRKRLGTQSCTSAIVRRQFRKTKVLILFAVGVLTELGDAFLMICAVCEFFSGVATMLWTILTPYRVACDIPHIIKRLVLI